MQTTLLVPVRSASQPTTSSINTSRIQLAGGVTIHNDITIGQGNPTVAQGATGVIQYAPTTAGDATVVGTITIQANNANGGLLNGPTFQGSDFLNITGAVNVAGSADTIVQIGGNVRYSGGGNYPNLQINGEARLGVSNSLSQTALLQLATVSAAIFNMNGFNQTALALSSTTGNGTVQNNSGTVSTLTLNTTGTNGYNSAATGIST